MTNKKYKSISISNLIINPDNDRFESVENEKQAIDIMLTKLGDKIYYIAIHILFFGIMKVFSVCEDRMLLVGNAANYSS